MLKNKVIWKLKSQGFSKKRSVKGLDGYETLGKRMLELVLVVFRIRDFFSF